MIGQLFPAHIQPVSKLNSITNLFLYKLTCIEEAIHYQLVEYKLPLRILLESPSLIVRSDVCEGIPTVDH